MLRSTLLHLPGIGPVRERRLWAEGVTSWEELATREPDSLAGEEARESCRRWEACDWNYFDQRLPASEKWRAFADFEDRALHVDIETDGTDFITVIGAFDGLQTHLYVAGRDLGLRRVGPKIFPFRRVLLGLFHVWHRLDVWGNRFHRFTCYRRKY